MTGSTLLRYSERFYQNQGNPELLDHLRYASGRLLDVGCGAGDNARLVGARHEGLEITGITASRKEADVARQYMRSCLVADIEDAVPADLPSGPYDCVLFSHVLEHLREPSKVLASFVPYVRDGGQVLVAVPNVANFRSRWQLLKGRFEYEPSGVFDETHLRFFTYHSVDRFLLREATGLHLVEKTVSGSIPLWVLRHHIPNSLRRYLDRMGCRLSPNLFGAQVNLDLTKRPSFLAK